MESFEFKMINGLLKKGFTIKSIKDHTGISEEFISRMMRDPEIKCDASQINKLIKYHCYLQTINGKNSKDLRKLVNFIKN